ncbi:MAG TPA: hypothetical protein VI819_03820 [Patescibacteria group bacterium]|nr:hypothetical protein [Patescibacteria group bacterium]
MNYFGSESGCLHGGEVCLHKYKIPVVREGEGACPLGLVLHTNSTAQIQGRCLCVNLEGKVRDPYTEMEVFYVQGRERPLAECHFKNKGKYCTGISNGGREREENKVPAPQKKQNNEELIPFDGTIFDVKRVPNKIRI